MVSFGYWAAQEEYSPNRLLEFARLAEKRGFEMVTASDHFHPWFNERAHGGFSWIWLAMCAERTSNVKLGTGVSSIHRYHPAIIAQAFGTLGSQYSDRIFLSLGTGESINVLPLGFEWPEYEERSKKLEESIQIIRELWKGEFFDFKGEYYEINDARLYTTPGELVAIYIAASGPKSSRLAGRLGDGIFTFVMDPKRLRNDILPAFREGTEEPEKGKEKILEFKISFHENEEKAAESCRN